MCLNLLHVTSNPEITLREMPVFGVFLVRIQSECGKIRTRKTPNTDTFHALLLVNIFSSTSLNQFTTNDPITKIPVTEFTVHYSEFTGF